MQASSAPISGRRMMRAVALMLASRSSLTGMGGGAAVVGAGPGAIELMLITLSSSGAGRPAPRGAGRAGTLLAGALTGQLLDGRRVGLLDEPGAREDRLAAADGVGVV